MDSSAGLGTVLIRATSVFSLVPLWSPAIMTWFNKSPESTQTQDFDLQQIHHHGENCRMVWHR